MNELKVFSRNDRVGTVSFTAEPEAEEPKYESPYGSRWIVSVDMHGSVSILNAPNIHWGFFENSGTAEEVGLPFEMDLEQNPPGVYEWICSPSPTSGDPDDGLTFEIQKERVLFALPTV